MPHGIHLFFLDLSLSKSPGLTLLRLIFLVFLSEVSVCAFKFSTGLSHLAIISLKLFVSYLSFLQSSWIFSSKEFTTSPEQSMPIPTCLISSRISLAVASSSLTPFTCAQTLVSSQISSGLPLPTSAFRSFLLLRLIKYGVLTTVP